MLRFFLKDQVTFHGSEQNMLLSGSQDGTMKYFDIRMKAAVMTFVRYGIHSTPFNTKLILFMSLQQ